jgi:TolB-like protein/Tfp pilus assembly protein PilF
MITIYAAVAFVILQLVDIVAEPLRLPVSTKALVIVLLCIGFVIAVFLSWIYDITPAGVQKTKPAGAIRHNGLTSHASSTGWKIATLISVLVIVALMAFNFINKGRENSDISKLKKSIAVLPFINDSPGDSNQYFINGVMEEVLKNLQNIKDFRVLSRTSTNQYKGPDRPTIPEIAKKLDVNYIVEGSGQKYGNKLVLRVQLITGRNERHLWAKSYDRKIQQTTDIIEVQSEIARLIAGELKATITPEEKQLIERTPTSSLTAYDLCLKGNEMVRKWRYTGDSIYLKLAHNLLNQSIDIDSEYIDALSAKSMIFSETRQFDSALVYSKKILEIDPENSEGYNGIGLIYFYSNEPDSALKYFFREDEIDPNNPWTNLAIGQLYFFWKNDVIKGFPYYQKALDYGGDSEPEINQNISYVFFYIGDNGKAEKYLRKAIYLRPECELIRQYEQILFTQGKYDDAFHFLDSICSITDCGKYCDMTRFYIYTTQSEFEKAESYYIKTVDAGFKKTVFDSVFKANYIYIGYLYNETGRRKEALSILKRSIERDENFLKGKNNLITLSAFKLKLAAAYSIIGEKNKALRYLSELINSGMFVEWPFSVRTFPGFDKLRIDPEFKAILKRSDEKKASLRALVKNMEQKGVINM